MTSRGNTTCPPWPLQGASVGAAHGHKETKAPPPGSRASGICPGGWPEILSRCSPHLRHRVSSKHLSKHQHLRLELLGKAVGHPQTVQAGQVNAMEVMKIVFIMYYFPQKTPGKIYQGNQLSDCQTETVEGNRCLRESVLSGRDGTGAVSCIEPCPPRETR